MSNQSDLPIILIAVLTSVVALAWRDASQQAFETYYPDDAKSLKARVVYAMIATLIAVTVLVMMAKTKR